MKYELGIVVLNYCNWTVTKECIDSIMRQLVNIHFRVYLIDNASPNKEPADFFKDWESEKYLFIRSKQNKGYAAGNNLGIRIAMEECDYILICNSDVVFIDNSIEKMLCHFKTTNDKKLGVMAPQLLNADLTRTQPSLCIKTSLLVKYLVKTPLRHIPTQVKKDYYGFNRNINLPFYVYTVHGSCFMVSNKFAKKILPFDEHTFLYEEESILGVRMEQEGIRALYYPQARVVHRHGQSTKLTKAIPYICICESEIYYLRTYIHAKRRSIVPLYLYRVCGYLLRCIIAKEYRKHLSEFLYRTVKELKA